MFSLDNRIQAGVYWTSEVNKMIDEVKKNELANIMAERGDWGDRTRLNILRGIVGRTQNQEGG